MYHRPVKYAFCIVRAWLDENIKVFSRAWLSMDRDSVPADDKVFNAVLVEGGQEFFEVLTEHLVLVPSIDNP